MALATTAASVAGAAALATYLDGKYQIRKDLHWILRLRNAEKEYKKRAAANRISLWYVISDACRKQAANRAIWSRTGCVTFQELHDDAARYGQWLLAQGIRPGDLVALYLLNSTHFMVLWAACLCIGAAPAFINYNLEGKGLLHCLKVCETKLIIVDEDVGCQKRIEGSRGEIESSGTKIVTLDTTLKQQVEASATNVPGDEYRNGVTGEFPACLIYTSGTTGLPKGCAFTQMRIHLLGAHIEPSFEAKPGVDQWYNAMPLYHGTGAITCFTSILGGVPIAVAPRFSVSKFWDDVYDSGSTFFIYVGETARYLLNAPPHPHERDHKVRCAYGNGLRPDIWKKFQARFNIPQIAEFFNSTEGMFVLLNWDKGDYQAACVGHHGLILRRVLHNTYVPVLIDHESGDIWRDPKTGFAKRMPYEQGGEMLVAIPNKQAFQGYWRSEEATNKRYATDVFKKGDLYYRSGDALRRTPDGRWYFLDRLGDTYRWKSENVSTAEVSECLGKFPGVAEANVYGVLVPNHEGRAGCAAIHLEPTVRQPFDYNALLKYAQANLPRYAVPIFIRVVKASTHIHNHKQNKVPLRKEGVDPSLIGSESPEGKDDKILWLPPREQGYVEFKQSDWDKLAAGQARL